MASETISEHLILKIFLGEHAPGPPSCCMLTATGLWPYQLKYLGIALMCDDTWQ